MKRYRLMAIVLPLTSCLTPESSALKMAAVELGCPATQLSLSEKEANIYLVKGCGEAISLKCSGNVFMVASCLSENNGQRVKSSLAH